MKQYIFLSKKNMNINIYSNEQCDGMESVRTEED